MFDSFTAGYYLLIICYLCASLLFLSTIEIVSGASQSMSKSRVDKYLIYI